MIVDKMYWLYETEAVTKPVFYLRTSLSLRLPIDDRRDREQQALMKLIRSQREKIPIWEQLATDQFDPWQFVPRQVFIPNLAC